MTTKRAKVIVSKLKPNQSYMTNVIYCSFFNEILHKLKKSTDDYKIEFGEGESIFIKRIK
jgi:hypothetical protein